jgi:hypothetical protein
MNFGRRGGFASLRRIASAHLADPNAVAGHERLSADECSTFVALFRFALARLAASYIQPKISQNLLSPTGLASNIELLRLGRPVIIEMKGLRGSIQMRATCPKWLRHRCFRAPICL